MSSNSMPGFPREPASQPAQYSWVDSISPSENAISVLGEKFVDSYGRQVIFNGINLVNKDPAADYIDTHSEQTFDLFRKWGFNCVRLGVIWAGVEPEPGKYDEKYLDTVQKEVDWAARNGLYVILDMHQDLYGVHFVGKGGDGAPEWATLADNLPDSGGEVWSDSYFFSLAVQKAFDNFWANAPCADGVGVQDHYARMWQHVAKRFATNKAVIGFDIMNEPFYGTPGKHILSLILKEYAKLFAEETGKVLSEKELSNIWSDDEQRTEALASLQNSEKYARAIDAATEPCQQFDKTSLQSMYQRVADAIREVDTTHILFIEHSYLENMGISSGIEPVKGKNDKPDPLVAYAAHGYDPLVDTKKYHGESNSRVKLIFSRIDSTAQRINLPLLVGEWGAFSGSLGDMTSSARFIVSLFERFGLSDTYWAYHEGVEKDSFFFNAVVRPYPPFIGGTLKTYGFNHETGVFNCSWKESPLVKAPTVIYVPDLERLVRASITLNPGSSKIVIRPIESSKAGFLIVPVTGDSLSRRLEFKLNEQ